MFVVEDADGGRDIVSRILRRASYEVHAAADPAGGAPPGPRGPAFSPNPGTAKARSRDRAFVSYALG